VCPRAQKRERPIFLNTERKKKWGQDRVVAEGGWVGGGDPVQEGLGEGGHNCCKKDDQNKGKLIGPPWEPVGHEPTVWGRGGEVGDTKRKKVLQNSC